MTTLNGSECRGNPFISRNVSDHERWTTINRADSCAGLSIPDLSRTGRLFRILRTISASNAPRRAATTSVRCDL